MSCAPFEHTCPLIFIFVGCSLLALLLKRVDVSKIFLLNRKSSVTQQERQAAGFQTRGLDPRLLEVKKSVITYLDIDFSRKDLGLTRDMYEEVSPLSAMALYLAHALLV